MTGSERKEQVTGTGKVPVTKGKGIVLVGGKDQAISGKAKRARLPVVGLADLSGGGSETTPVQFEKTLIVAAGTRVPWDLLPAAWNFLSRWDAAVPLWRYGVTAQDLGDEAERKLTRGIVRDLRVLVHSYELLFVRGNESGLALVEKWVEEMGRPSTTGKKNSPSAQDADKRLAFLRAVYQVKPRLCVLPISWLAKVREQSSQAVRSGRRVRNPKAGVPLVKVEVSPGRFVKCHAGDEARVRREFGRQVRRH